MRILVDADACAVRQTAEQIAQEKNCECILFHDFNHEIHSDYCEVRAIEPGRDAVDFAIVRECKADDIVVTNDAGLAAMVLNKAASVINFYGTVYTQKSVDGKLAKSHIMKVCRRNNDFRHIPKKKRKKSKSSYSRFGPSLSACMR